MKYLASNSKILLTLALLTSLISGCANPNINNNVTSGNNPNINTSTNNSLPNSTQYTKVASEDISIKGNSSNTSTPSTKKEVKTENIPNTNSGLLIGLSKDNKQNKQTDSVGIAQNDYRTLWVQHVNSQATYLEKKNEIITPYKDSFYKLANNKFVMSKPTANLKPSSDSIYFKYEYYYEFFNIVSHLADKPMKDLFTPETFRKNYLHEQEGYMGETFKFNTDWLQYVGNNYACVMNNYYDTGGGTYRSWSNDFKMYDLANLSNLDGIDKSLSLIDLLEESEKKKLEEYSSKYNKIKEQDKLVKVEQAVDTKNLSLKRKAGKWEVVVPLYELYQHNGNGSRGRGVTEYIETDIKLPKSIASYDTLCIDWENIKKKLPEAKDAVSSPNNDMLAVLTPSKLLIFTNPQNGINKPSLSIDVDSNESIILNQWAVGEYVDKWNKLISNY